MDMDKLRTKMEKRTGKKVKSVIDLDDRHFVVTFVSDAIPGEAYKIDKRTGKSSFYNPVLDFEAYRKAISENRYRIYSE